MVPTKPFRQSREFDTVMVPMLQQEIRLTRRRSLSMHNLRIAKCIIWARLFQLQCVLQSRATFSKCLPRCTDTKPHSFPKFTAENVWKFTTANISACISFQQTQPNENNCFFFWLFAIKQLCWNETVCRPMQMLRDKVDAWNLATLDQLRSSALVVTGTLIMRNRFSAFCLFS